MVAPHAEDTQDLVDRVRSGDRSAIDELFARHRQRLCRLVKARMDDRLAARVDASDVVQDTLLVACQRLSEFLDRSPIPFYPWLRRIAWDRLIDLHRRHIVAGKRSVKQEKSLDISDASAIELAQQLAASAGPAGKALRKEQRTRIRSLLSQLSDADREIMIMKHVEVLDNVECAAALGTSVAAVKKRYVRALGRIRKLMEDEFS